MKTQPIKIHFPEPYKSRFMDFCTLNKLRYGRVIWTLCKMLVKGKIDGTSFLVEYNHSGHEVRKSHTDILLQSRISGKEAHELKKLTNTTDSDIVKEDK